MAARFSAKKVVMATAKQSRNGGQRRRAAQWMPRAVVVAVLILAGLTWYGRSALMERAVAGTSYGARVACSCRFLGGRSLSDCTKDFEPGMSLVRLSEDSAAKSVTAKVPLMTSQTATYREGYGCVLERWDG